MRTRVVTLISAPFPYLLFNTGWDAWSSPGWSRMAIS